MGNIIASNTNNVASFDGSGTSLSFKKPVSGTDATFTGKITYNNMEGTTVKGTTGNFGTVNVDAGGDVKIGTASLNSRITALETSSATTSSTISSGNFNTGTFSGLLTANRGLSGTTGTFSGALNANGGLSGTTGTFSGALNADGGLSGTTGTFSGALNADGGLSVGTLRTNQNATINGNLTTTGTGTFSGDLNANKGTFSQAINVQVQGRSPGTYSHIGYEDGKNYLRGETVIQLGNLNVQTEGYFARSIKAGYSATVPVITKGTGTTASTIPSVPQNGLLLGSGDAPWSLAEVKPSEASTNNRLCFIKGTQVFACLDTSGNLQAANDPAWT